MSDTAAGRGFASWHVAWSTGRAPLTAAVVVIVIVQLFSLLTLTKAHPVWADEGSYADVAMQFIRHGNFAWPVMAGDHGFERSNVAFGRLYSGSLGTTFALTGFGLFQGRLHSYLYGLLSILLTYLLCRRLKAPPVIAAWAAALASAAYIAIDTSHTVRPEAMVTAVAAFALYLLLVAEARDSTWLYAVVGLVAALGADVHSNGVCIPFALAAVVIWRLGWRRAFGRVALPFAAGATLGVAWWLGVHVLPDPALFREQWGFWSAYAEPPMLGFLKHPISWVLYDAGRILAPGVLSPRLVSTAGYWALFAVAVTTAIVAVRRRRRIRELDELDASARRQLRDILTPAVFVVAFTVLLLMEAGQRAPAYYAYTIPEISATVLLCTTVLARRWRLIVRAMAIVVATASLAGMGYLTWHLRGADYNGWSQEIHRSIPPHSTVFGWEDLRFAFDDVTFRGYTTYFYKSAPAGSYVVMAHDRLEEADRDDPALAKVIAERGVLIAEVEDAVYGRNLGGSPKQDTYTTFIYRLR